MQSNEGELTQQRSNNDIPISLMCRIFTLKNFEEWHQAGGGQTGATYKTTLMKHHSKTLLCRVKVALVELLSLGVNTVADWKFLLL